MYYIFFKHFLNSKIKRKRQQAPRVVGPYTHHGVWASWYRTGITQGVPVEGAKLQTKIRG